MPSAKKRLQISIGLKDRFSGPLSKLRKRLYGFNQSVTSAKERVLSGVVGGAAGIATLQAFINPAREVKLALREVASLDVEPKALQALRREALQFGADFGGSAPDIIRSAYDIQSAIAGLKGDELAKFTRISGIMAKGTKSDAATITNYVGTMYGIQKKMAAKMGKTAWLESLAGQFAQSVQQFKTTGSEMGAAFGALGAAAQSAGIETAEQFSVLGRLQATMSGTEAATKYRAFLSNVGAAQEELGLKFTDASGKMLSMPEILGRIRSRFGEIDTVAKSDMIKKAFGTDEAVALIKLLSTDIGGLSEDIKTVGQASGMGQVTKMAAAMVDPFDRLAGQAFKLREAFAKHTLEGLTPFVNGMSELMGYLTGLTKRFPTFTQYVGMAVIGVTGLALAGAAFSIILGVANMAVAGAKLMLMGYRAAVWLVRVDMHWLNLQIGYYTIRQKAQMAITKMAKAGMLAWQGAIWLVNAALNANPIGLVVMGIAAMVGVIAVAIKYWQEIKSAIVAVAEWFNRMPTWGRVLASVFAPFVTIPLLIIANFKKIKAAISDTFRWLEKIPGFNLFSGDSSQQVATPEAYETVSIGNSPVFGETANVPQSFDGANPLFRNQSQTNNHTDRSQSQHIGEVRIYPQQIDSENFERELKMAAAG